MVAQRGESLARDDPDVSRVVAQRGESLARDDPD